MKQRPIIHIPLTNAQKVQKALSFFWIIISFGLVFWYYNQLPERIPSHYNLSGEPDGYSGKAILILLPIISSVLVILMTTLAKYPHTFNYHVPLTPENTQQLYTKAVKLVSDLTYSISFIFLLIISSILYTAMNVGNTLLGKALIPLILILIFYPIIKYFLSLKASES